MEQYTHTELTVQHKNIETIKKMHSKLTNIQNKIIHPNLRFVQSWQEAKKKKQNQVVLVSTLCPDLLGQNDLRTSEGKQEQRALTDRRSSASPPTDGDSGSTKTPAKSLKTKEKEDSPCGGGSWHQDSLDLEMFLKRMTKPCCCGTAHIPDYTNSL